MALWKIVGWVKQSATQQSPEMLGFVPQTPRATSRHSRKGVVAPQPTHFKVFGVNPSWGQTDISLPTPR